MKKQKQIPKLTREQKAQILGDTAGLPAPDAGIGPTNPLAGLHTLCTDSPRRLISLLDMTNLIAADLLDAFNSVEEVRRSLFQEQQQLGAAAILADSHTASAMRTLALVTDQAQKLHLQGTLSRITPLGLRLYQKTGSFGVVIALFDDLLSAMRGDVDGITCTFIEKSKAQYFEQDDLFGEPGKPFKPLASDAINAEIKAVGNCLAADLNTAAVFHLMRVAEHGLHALAIHLEAWPATRTTLEYSEWGKVIEAIGDVLNDRRKALPPGRGSSKEKEQRFYDGLLADLAYFLHDRNPVSHLRGHYETDEALLVFRKVGDFIKRLPPRVPLK
jgi:hypothetical protein